MRFVGKLGQRIRQEVIRSKGKYDVVVVSYGGSGTTALARHLGQSLRVNSPNSEIDGILHAASPAHPIFDAIDAHRAIYVFGNPAESVLSVFRRGFQTRMASKLRSVHSNKREYMRAIRKSDASLEFDAFLRAGHDIFGLYEHLQNWTNPDLVPFPILNVKYEALFESSDIIGKFVRDPESALEFPERIPRASHLDDLPATQAVALSEIYRDALELYESLPDIALHEPRI